MSALPSKVVDMFSIISPIPAKEEDYKSTLLPLLLETSVLSFGSRILKSGRVSPYFFNSSLLHTAPLLRSLASAYTSVLSSPPYSLPSGTETDGSSADGAFKPTFDILFGPAYKGIPLCAAVVTELAHQGGHFDTVSYSFNRKEAKDHGEGGIIVGAPLKGKRVVVIDDVMTAGTALREAVSIIKQQGGTIVGVVLLLTRQERVSDEEPRSAMQVAEDELGIPVRAVLKFEDIVEAIEAGRIKGAGAEQLKELRDYREKYGSRD
jgi:orotate phosphoribosyltransferase